MIELEANNQLLEIDRRNLRFNITYRSPYFGYLTSFVFNFLIPNTDRNSRTFNFPLRLNRISKTRVNLPGRILSDGIELAAGTWEAATAGEDFIELSFTFIADELVSALTSKTLPEIFDEEIATENIITHVEETVLKAWPETDYQFPSVYAPDFYGGENESFLGVINNFESDFVNDDFNLNTIVPMPYLFGIIKRIFEFAGFEVYGEIFEDEMLKKALLLNNHALDRLISIAFYGNQSEAYHTVIEKDFIVIWDFFSDQGGFYNPDTGKYNIGYPGTYNIDARIVHYKLAFLNYTVQVIRKVGATESILFTSSGIYSDFEDAETLISLDVEIDNNLGEIFVKVTCESGGSLVKTSYFNITSPENKKINAYQESFNLKNHVPPHDAIEFLKMFFQEFQVFPRISKERKVALISFSELHESIPQKDLTQGLLRGSLKIKQNDYKGYRMFFDFDEQTIFTPDVVHGEVDTYFDLPSHIENYLVVLVKSLNAYLTHVYNEELDAFVWEPLADISPQAEDAQKDREIPLKFAPLFMRNFDNRIESPRSLPFFDGSGTSHAYKLTNDFPDIRIMFYVGYNLSFSDSADKYPFASTSKYNTQGEEVLPYNYFASEVASRYWSSALAWLKTRLEVEFEKHFTPLELKMLSMAKNQMLLDSTIIIEEIYANVDPDLSKAKVKGYSS